MASDDDRSRAKRIRKLGDKASPTQRKWLRDYEAKRDAAKAKRADKAIEEKVAVEATATVEPSSSTPMAEVVFPAAPELHEPDEDADAKPLLDTRDSPQIAGGQGATGAPSAAPDSPTAIPTPGLHDAVAPIRVCADPDCPACGKHVGGTRCAATGKIVWAAIDQQTAEGTAMMLLGLVGMAISFFTKKPAVEPTADEIAYMGAALQKATYRRVNALGAYDDLLMLGMALGMYANRARKGGEA